METTEFRAYKSPLRVRPDRSFPPLDAIRGFGTLTVGEAMRNRFPGYYRPADEQLRSLWQNGTFVLDANVLLNVYRYSEETAHHLLNLLATIAARLWVPHQPALEFHRNRPEEIFRQATTKAW
jgi:hypothetical protein